ncbi:MULTISPECIES: MFS transporter [Streptomyces]|uniref:3,4-AHBA transporter n=3 Tax=Streptomyces griseus TaxID=1911 RepID=B1VTI6_STRGG|nr:MFS transporter [Streptomyces griseus]MBW3706731.1 MFS transporter [Streptomyces griseus]SEE71221.1 MFS transporter, AAHS family, benzoate transport protein [Streptomyces griseus]SQA27060.1 3,4-AHBA transporter [Streptomyces griseus]BAF36649.1 putative benzoate transport protein [Streptomyces griseus subsp. griseus NBRC 13350]BAG21076.1 putative 3,4-AHBA transporter [Streptomyces griseus subsp. griseus NBRC 13350]
MYAVLALCWLLVFFDGLDVTVYGAVMPYMLDDTAFGLDAAAAGRIGSWTTFGMLIGALAAGTITDWIGRRTVLVWCVLLFSAGSGVCALAGDPLPFGAGRFLAGLGLGGLMPICLTVVAEFAPPRRMALATGVLMTAYHAGGMAATGLGLALAPDHGWRWPFAAGVLPAIIAVPLLLRHLPESPGVLYARGRFEQARLTAERYGLPAPSAADAPAAGASGRLRAVRDLVAPGRALATLLLWAASFCGLLLVYGISTWLPQLMRSAGYGLSTSVALLMVINAGGIVGMPVAGRVADRFGAVRVATCWFLLTAAGLALLATGPSLALTYAVVAFTGIWLFSASTMVYAVAGRFYPAADRAAGLGWVTGVGRLGAVVSPMLGGALVARGLGSGGFLVFALGGVLGAVTVLLVPVVAAARTRTDAGRAAGGEPGDAAGAGREPNSRAETTSPGRTR